MFVLLLLLVLLQFARSTGAMSLQTSGSFLGLLPSLSVLDGQSVRTNLSSKFKITRACFFRVIGGDKNQDDTDAFCDHFTMIFPPRCSVSDDRPGIFLGPLSPCRCSERPAEVDAHRKKSLITCTSCWLRRVRKVEN